MKITLFHPPPICTLTPLYPCPIRLQSRATRGEVGGLATTTREVCEVLDAFGFQRIIIETVGVGQSALTIAATADTAVLVLVPESGDGVQVLKAGVMEIADLYAINKADRPGAERLRNEIEVMLGIRRGNAFRHVGAHHAPAAGRRAGAPAVEARAPGGEGESWEPPALQLAAVQDEGVAALVDAIERHASFLARTGELARRRQARTARHTREVVDRAAAETPDTLLLAEAFWLMEGYFVRTLGMHRVYNSAFMNFLKNEDNDKFRLSIRNVLEFNPNRFLVKQILHE